MSVVSKSGNDHLPQKLQPTQSTEKLSTETQDKDFEGFNSESYLDDETFLVDKTDDLNLSPSLPPLYSGTIDAYDDENATSPTHIAADATQPTSLASKWKSALGEARYIAGGLIARPFESTKHFTILRHSHGLVFYQGSSTSIAITIFSDRPLPDDRRLWLQTKGWTGKTGMKAKALLRTNNNWIEVTPATKVEPAQLPPSDERAWQRDIRKFLEKAPKQLRHHKVRETDILRIPYIAGDGYFRVVLTGGENKTPFCPSPVFRVASTSTSSSSIKGASLLTLPMELGVKVLSSTATTAAGNAAIPITSALKSQVSNYVPSWTTEVGSELYHKSGVHDKLSRTIQKSDRAADTLNNHIDFEPESIFDRTDVVGDEMGPTSPYPFRIDSKIIKGTGRCSATLGMPTANLHSSPDDLMIRLSGTYFGWAAVSKTNEDISQGWKHALITVGPCPYSNPTVVPRRIIKAYLIHDFGGLQFVDAKISVIVMGFLRSYTPQEQEDALYETYKDISVAQTSLGRPGWSVEAALERIKAMKSSRSKTERFVELRHRGVKLADKVPLDKVGVRTPWAGLKDKREGNGGLWVLR